MIKQLDILLSAIVVAMENVHGRHVNVTGPHFHALHRMFGDIYKMLFDHSDKVREMVRQLKEFPVFNLSQMIELSPLRPDEIIVSPDEMGVDTATELESLWKMIDRYVAEPGFDEITKNDLAQIGGEIRQQWYFISSYNGKV